MRPPYYRLLILGTIYVGMHLYAAYRVWQIGAPGPALWLASTALPMLVLVLLVAWAIRSQRSQHPKMQRRTRPAA